MMTGDQKLRVAALKAQIAAMAGAGTPLTVRAAAGGVQAARQGPRRKSARRAGIFMRCTLTRFPPATATGYDNAIPAGAGDRARSPAGAIGRAACRVSSASTGSGGRAGGPIGSGDASCSCRAAGAPLSGSAAGAGLAALLAMASLAVFRRRLGRLSRSART